MPWCWNSKGRMTLEIAAVATCCRPGCKATSGEFYTELIFVARGEATPPGWGWLGENQHLCPTCIVAEKKQRDRAHLTLVRD